MQAFAALELALPILYEPGTDEKNADYRERARRAVAEAVVAIRGSKITPEG
jgi:hypothetical protein